MLPRRLFYKRSTTPVHGEDPAGLLKQISLALFVVFALAIAVAMTTEAIALITPTHGLATVP